MSWLMPDCAGHVCLSGKAAFADAVQIMGLRPE
jgi:hypothetical protein